MKRESSRTVTILCGAFFVANFLSFLGADLWYSTVRTTAPNLATGRIYPHRQKMYATVYLTASEMNGLSLLPLAGLVGFALAGLATVMEPKAYTSLGTIKEPVFTKRDSLIFLISIACYVAIVVFLGPAITDFAVSHGIILNLEGSQYGQRFFGGN
jgi:hypothetical protein